MRTRKHQNLTAGLQQSRAATVRGLTAPGAQDPRVPLLPDPHSGQQRPLSSPAHSHTPDSCWGRHDFYRARRLLRLELLAASHTATRTSLGSLLDPQRHPVAPGPGTNAVARHP